MREDAGAFLSQTDELAALRLLSGDVRPYHGAIIVTVMQNGARGELEPLEERFLLRESEAKETAGPGLKVCGYFQTTAQFVSA